MWQPNSIINTVIIVVIALSLSSCDYYAQVPDCRDFFNNNPVNSFSTDNRGLAQDKKTKLLWYRCAAGQSYKNSECKGEALHLNWEEAMAFAEEFSEKSGKKWRLPSKKELKSIMLDQCINPAVDVRVFKDLEVNNFWTSSDSLNSDLFRCSVYTFKGDLFCRQPKTTRLPFLLVGGAK